MEGGGWEGWRGEGGGYDADSAAKKKRKLRFGLIFPKMYVFPLFC